MWIDNIGKWKTKVIGARTNQINGNHRTNSQSQLNLLNGSLSSESHLLFEIQVELHDDSKENNFGNFNYPESSHIQNQSRFREGWVIYRSYKQFENLNEGLIELIPSDLKAKFKKIPSMLKKSYQDEKIKQVTANLDEYLRIISQDESLAQSEALYTFLCPSPDYFKRSNSQNAQTNNDEKFSITSIFKV